MSTYKHSLQPFNYLKERAESNPDQLLFDGIEVSATNIFAFEFVKKLATYFREVGVKKGQTVALYLPEPLYIMFMIATWHEAAVSVSFVPSFESKLSWTPDWLFATEDFPKDSAKNIIKVDDLFTAELEKKELAEESFKFDSVEDRIKILFSSGTTGIPKAIPLTIAQLEARENASKMYWPDSGAFLFTFRLTAITSFQAFFANLNMNTTYLMPREASHNLKLIKKHQVSQITAAPNHILELLGLIERSGISTDTVKKVIVGGSKLSEDLAQRIERVLGAELVNAYGSTEAGWVSSRVGHSLDPSNLGEIADGVNVRIFDEQHHEVLSSESGLIGVRSKQCVSGYYLDPITTEKQFKNGWFFSGDIGRVVNGNQLFLDGRIDDRINSGGVKIEPSLIENFIIGKFLINDAGGFSFPGEKGIELFGLAIVSEKELNIDEILEFSKKEFGAKAPSVIIQIENIPRNEQGKIQRDKLKEKYFQNYVF